jgi:hypothetical protein
VVAGTASSALRGAVHTVVTSDELTGRARWLAIGAALVAGIAAPAALATFLLTLALLAGAPPDQPMPGWIDAVASGGMPGALAAAVACGGWGVFRNQRGKADSDLLLFAAVGLLGAFMLCCGTCVAVWS